jgi:polysaccharide biosynthesis PFTS motif protein
MRVSLTKNYKIYFYSYTKRLLSKKVNFTTSSKVLIGFPFTSPVIIGQELTVPSIFYSSANTLVKYNPTNFIQIEFELRKYIEISLGK